MNQYFKAAVDRYKKLLPKNKKDEGFLINPISEVDCEIIVELKELIKKAGNDKAIAILKEYKGSEKDVDIRDSLIQCNIETEDSHLEEAMEEFDEKGGTKGKRIDRKREFIIIEKDRIQSEMIFGYDIVDNSDIEDEEYQLVINPTQRDATRIPFYANKTYTFYSEDDLNGILKVIDKQLEKANVKFVNKEEDEELDE